MTRGRLVAIGVVGYLAFLCAQIPANQVYRWARPSLPIRAYGITGSIWRGSATAVIRARSRLDNVTWRILPTRLLLGRLAYRVSTNSGASDAQAQVGLGVGGITVRDLHALADAPTVQQWLGTPPLPFAPQGTLKANLSEVAFSRERLRSASGTLRLEHLAVRLEHLIPLGTLVIHLTRAASGVHGSFTGEGAFQGSGQLALEPSGSVSLKANFRLSNTADPQIQQLLRMAGVANPRERMRLRVDGNIYRGTLRSTLGND